MTPDTWELQGWCIADAAACEAHIAALALADVATMTEDLPADWHRPGADLRGTLVQVTLDGPAEVIFSAGPAGGGSGAWQVVAAGQQILLDARYWMHLRKAGQARVRVWQAGHADPPPPADDLAQWRQQGYAFLRDALSAGRVAALNTAIDRAMKADVACFGEAALKAKGHYGALRNLPDLDPVFVELLNNNPAYALIDQVLPKGYILQTYDGLILAPGEGRYPWDFHTDLEALNGLGLADDKVLAVNVLYYLDETTPENGATHIVPNSHLSQVAAPRQSLLEECAIPATGQPGDILVFDSRLWHCAGNNITNASRRLIKTLYCLPWIRPAMDYRSALSDGKWEALPDRVKTLLGADVRVPTSVAEFRGMEARCTP